MNITSLYIKGIGPHTETEIDFSRLQSPAALCAPYGSGKTTLLESILLCLYGRGGWYPGNVYELLTQGGTGEAEIVLEFEQSDSRYLARRTIKDTGRTKTQKASLYRSEEMIAGPKVGDFETAVREIVGDLQTFLATQFLSQNRAFDLCGQPGEESLAARRRKVFFELLGASELDAIEQRAGETLRDLQAEAKVLEAQVAGAADLDTHSQSYAEDIERCEQRLRENKSVLARAEEALAESQNHLNGLEAGDETLRARIDRHEALRQDIESRQQDLEERQADVRRLQASVDKIPDLENGVAELAKAQAAQKRLSEHQTTHRAYIDRKRLRDAASAQIEAQKTLVTEQESAVGCDPETVALANDLPQRQETLQQARQQHEARMQAYRQQEQKRQEINLKKARAEALLNDLQEKNRSKPETPGGDVCQTCPLLQDFAGLDDRIAKGETLIAEYSVQIAALNIPEPQADFADLETTVQEALRAADRVAAAERNRQRLDEHRQTLQRLQAEYDELPDPGEPVADRSLELNAASEDCQRLAAAPAMLDAARQAQVSLTQQQARCTTMEKALDKMQGDLEASRADADAARRAIGEKEQQRTALRAAIDQARTDRDSAREAVDSLTSSLATQKAGAESIRRQIEEREQRRKQANDLRGRVDSLQDVRSCFGSRGVRQILVDAAAPELEAIADRLFDIATDGRLRLRIATQTVNTDGSTAEDFAILVRDERGERDATRYSGGQLQLIQIVFRVAVALWIAKMRERRPECLVLDEAFDRLGADGTNDLLRVLQHLENEFTQIVVVTHDRVIASRMRTAVMLEKGVLGVQTWTEGTQQQAA